MWYSIPGAKNVVVSNLSLQSQKVSQSTASHLSFECHPDLLFENLLLRYLNDFEFEGAQESPNLLDTSTFLDHSTLDETSAMSKVTRCGREMPEPLCTAVRRATRHKRSLHASSIVHSVRKRDRTFISQRRLFEELFI